MKNKCNYCDKESVTMVGLTKTIGQDAGYDVIQITDIVYFCEEHKYLIKEFADKE